MADVTAAAPTGWRREVRSFAELLALCGFAITLPLLDLFGRGVEQFALRGASPFQIVTFAVGITLLPATGLWLGEVFVGLVNQRARRALHLLYIGGLVAAFTMQVVRPLTTGPALLVVALAAGAAAATGYRRLPVVRLWLGFAALAPFGFLFLFLVTSPTAALIWDDSVASDVDVGNPAPVVMLVLDELPLASLLTADGEVDATLYPNFARLAGDSHWFRNATTVTSTTWHAVPTILTGQFPEDEAGPIAAFHPDSLFTLLGGRYDMRVTETISRMCPTSVCLPTTASSGVWRGLAGDAVRVMRSRLSLTRKAEDPVTGFAELAAPGEEGDAVFAGLDVSQPDRFRSLMDGMESDTTAFHFLHLLLPHVPYRHLPSGVIYEGPEPDIGRIPELDQWGDETWPVTLGRQRHLLQMAYVDRLVGVLLDELEAEGLYDEALVVVTADHGISFEAGGPIRAIEGQSLDALSTPDIMWVPFFVKEPGQTQGEISDANVQLIDVLPTIADVLDVDLPFPVDGQSALGPPRTTTDKRYYVNDVTPFGVSVDPPVTIDGVTGWAGVLERSAGRFLGRGGPERLWRVGPSPALIGQRVDELPAGTLSEVDAVLRTPGAYGDVRGDGFQPSLIRGHLDGSPHGTALAIVVNGVVAATGPTYREDGGLAFAVMVDEAAFREGSNEVLVYEVR